MSNFTTQINSLRKEQRRMRRRIGALEREVRQLRGDKLDNIIADMQHSAREMLRLSRDL